MVSRNGITIQTTLLAAVVVLLVSPMSLPFISQNANAQSGGSSNIDYQVVKTDKSEHFVFPYTSSNLDRKNPQVYTFDTPKTVNWILRIDNSLSYEDRVDSRTIIRIQEPAPSEKFIELALYGEAGSHRYWVAVNTAEDGYFRVHDNPDEGWERQGEPITVSFANNAGLTVTNGKRIVVDKLDTNGFTLGSVAVYGKDEDSSLQNARDGNLTFDLIYGDPADSPLFLLPFGIMIGMGALVGGLLVVKKRARVA